MYLYKKYFNTSTIQSALLMPNSISRYIKLILVGIAKVNVVPLIKSSEISCEHSNIFSLLDCYFDLCFCALEKFPLHEIVFK
mgnify:CR=1 FL=1